jgi:hypothetical protein
MGVSFSHSLYQHWSWIGILAMAASAAMLAWLIRGLVAVIRRAHLFRVPLAETQEVRFAEAGPVVLWVEGPRFTTRFRHVGFALSNEYGERVDGRRILFRAQVSGVSTVRMSLIQYTIPRAGRYVLRLTGLGAVREGDTRHAIVFTKPHLAQTVACILGMILAFAVLIVSLVFFILRLSKAGLET